jgi:hypothetical protein
MSTAAPSKPPSPLPAAPSPVRSFQVEHLHQFGQCTGLLTPSLRAVVFVSDRNSDDALVLTRAQFLSSADDHTLTIKTHEKTYRLRLVGDASPRVEADQLRALAEVLRR